jgi:uncharacterized protein (DUF1015 family)
MTQYGLKVPEILLPKTDTDLKAWAVIACDQYTQDRDYWQRAEAARKGKPSTLSLILPEVYLNDDDGEESRRIADIKRMQRTYLLDGVFARPFCGMVYVERTTQYGRKRCGLITAIDLEMYDWCPNSKSLVRATEATVPERLPPRMTIRRGAALEVPHIMLLVNDAGKRLVEGAGVLAHSNAPLYDTDLMLDAGHITGWRVSGNTAYNAITGALAEIARENTQRSGDVFLFAVGDGNHSLASAKAVWDEYKARLPPGSPELETHPARYALVEIVNIYDDGLTFEPIHRVIFNADKAALSAVLKKCPDRKVTELQPLLDAYLAEHKKSSIDYIHGAEEVLRLEQQAGAVGVRLPPVDKRTFFSTIAANGPLPRKSFSMGEASEKRFYFESRKLFVA